MVIAKVCTQAAPGTRSPERPQASGMSNSGINQAGSMPALKCKAQLSPSVDAELARLQITSSRPLALQRFSSSGINEARSGGCAVGRMPCRCPVMNRQLEITVSMADLLPGAQQPPSLKTSAGLSSALLHQYLKCVEPTSLQACSTPRDEISQL